MRDIGSLIFETPIQHDYEAGVEVRSLLPTEQLEEIDGRLAVLDTDPVSGTRVVKFWVDEVPHGTSEEGLSQRRERSNPVGENNGRDAERRSPDFGGGVDYQELILHVGKDHLWAVIHLMQGNVFPTLKDLLQSE